MIGLTRNSGHDETRRPAEAGRPGGSELGDTRPVHRREGRGEAVRRQPAIGLAWIQFTAMPTGRISALWPVWKKDWVRGSRIMTCTPSRSGRAADALYRARSR